jgi:hypothetical protein
MAGEVICPACGAENAATSRRCWMCGREAWRTSRGPAEAPESATAEPPLMATLVERPSVHRQPVSRLEHNMGLILIAVLVLAVFLGVFPFAPGAAIVIVVVAGAAFVVMMARGREGAEHGSVPAHLGGQSSVPQGQVEQRTNPASIILAVFGSILAVFGVLAIVSMCMVMSAIIAFGRMCGMILGIK